MSNRSVIEMKNGGLEVIQTPHENRLNSWLDNIFEARRIQILEENTAQINADKGGTGKL